MRNLLKGGLCELVCVIKDSLFESKNDPCFIDHCSVDILTIILAKHGCWEMWTVLLDFYLCKEPELSDLLFMFLLFQYFPLSCRFSRFSLLLVSSHPTFQKVMLF